MYKRTPNLWMRLMMSNRFGSSYAIHERTVYEGKRKSILCHFFHLGLGASIVFGKGKSNEACESRSFRRTSSGYLCWLLFYEFERWYCDHRRYPIETSPVLVVRDRWTKMVFCTRVALQRSSEMPSWIQMSFEWFEEAGIPENGCKVWSRTSIASSGWSC